MISYLLDVTSICIARQYSDAGGRGSNCRTSFAPSLQASCRIPVTQRPTQRGCNICAGLISVLRSETPVAHMLRQTYPTPFLERIKHAALVLETGMQ